MEPKTLPTSSPPVPAAQLATVQPAAPETIPDWVYAEATKDYTPRSIQALEFHKMKAGRWRR